MLLSDIPYSPSVVVNDNPKSTEFRRNTGRARALVRQVFDAMPGSPILVSSGKVHWLTAHHKLQQPRVELFDEERLLVMERTLKKLRNQYAPYLASIFHDPCDWLERQSLCLRALKEFLKSKLPNTTQTLHKRQTLRHSISQMLPCGRWQRMTIQIVDRWPELTRLLFQLAFLKLTHHDSTDVSLLEWLDRNGDLLARLCKHPDALSIQLALCDIQSKSNGGVDQRWLSTVTNLLSDEAIRNSAPRPAFAHAEDLAHTLYVLFFHHKLELPSPQTSTSFQELIYSHLDWLGQQPANSISKLTSLLGLLATPDLIESHRRALCDAHQHEKRLLKEINRARLNENQNYAASVSKSHVLAQMSIQSPATGDADTMSNFFSILALLQQSTPSIEQLVQLNRFLDQSQPMQSRVRIAVVTRWLGLQKKSTAKCFSTKLAVLTQLFARRGMSQRLVQHWKHSCRPRVSNAKEMALELVSTAVSLDLQSNEWINAVGCLERVIYDEGLRLTEPQIVACILAGAATNSPHAALQFWNRCKNGGVSSNKLQAARLSKWLSTGFDDLVQTYDWLNSKHDVLDDLVLLKRNCKNAEHVDLLRRAVHGHDRAAIKTLADCARKIETLKLTWPETCVESTESDWVAQYPSSLHEPLRRLAQVSRKASSIADQILQKQWPRSESVAEEISTLERMLSDNDWLSQCSPKRLERMHLSLKNLRQREVARKPVSEARLSMLRAKLERRTDQIMIEKICDSVHRQFAESVSGRVAGTIPERLKQSPYNQIPLAIAQLPDDIQRIAWRALSRSWDNSLELLNEPENEQFLYRLIKLGLRLEPWLSRDLEVRGRSSDGKEYRLAFTDDPLEILLMGQHFGTCLSLEGCNFFSTVSNLVDANKRVLYGRTLDGQVIGRCLFALTNRGRIQTFHRYAHSSGSEFSESVDLFAEQLANAMGTTLTDTGSIPCLVSKEWYNDGAYSVQTNVEANEIELLTQLHARVSKEDEDVDPYVLACETFGGHSAVLTAVESLLRREVHIYARLAKSLFIALRNERSLSLVNRVRLAAYVWRSGDRPLALSVFENMRPMDVLKKLGSASVYSLMYDKHAIDMFLAFDRRLTYLLLVRSRNRSIKCDADETDIDRRAALQAIAANRWTSRPALI